MWSALQGQGKHRGLDPRLSHSTAPLWLNYAFKSTAATGVGACGSSPPGEPGGAVRTVGSAPCTVTRRGYKRARSSRRHLSRLSKLTSPPSFQLSCAGRVSGSGAPPSFRLGNRSLLYGSGSGHLPRPPAKADPATAFPLIFLLGFHFGTCFHLADEPHIPSHLCPPVRLSRRLCSVSVNSRRQACLLPALALGCSSPA